MAKRKPKRRSRKRLSPFKMWGGYIGAGLFLFAWMTLTRALSRMFGQEGWTYFDAFWRLLVGITPSDEFNFNLMVFTWVIITVGFLIGWGIQTLIIRLKRR